MAFNVSSLPHIPGLPEGAGEDAPAKQTKSAVSKEKRERDQTLGSPKREQKIREHPVTKTRDEEKDDRAPENIRSKAH